MGEAVSECEICEQESGHHVLCPNYASAFIEEQNAELAALRTKLEEAEQKLIEAESSGVERAAQVCDMNNMATMAALIRGLTTRRRTTKEIVEQARLHPAYWQESYDLEKAENDSLRHDMERLYDSLNKEVAAREEAERKLAQATMREHPRAPNEKRDELELYLRDAFAAGCSAAQQRSLFTALAYAARESPKLRVIWEAEKAQARAEGMEEAAKVCDETADIPGNMYEVRTAKYCAEAIRSAIEKERGK